MTDTHERARDRVATIVRFQQEAMSVPDGHARRALMLAERLRSIAGDLESPDVTPERLNALRKMVDQAECGAWGCRTPAVLGHERVTRALTRAAAEKKVADRAGLVAHELAQWYPNALGLRSAIGAAIEKIRARKGKDDAVAEITRLLGLDGFAIKPDSLRSMTSRRRAARYGKRGAGKS